MTKNNLKIVKSGKNQEIEAKEKNKILNKQDLIKYSRFAQKALILKDFIDY